MCARSVRLVLLRPLEHRKETVKTQLMKTVVCLVIEALAHRQVPVFVVNEIN